MPVSALAVLPWYPLQGTTWELPTHAHLTSSCPARTPPAWGTLGLLSPHSTSAPATPPCGLLYRASWNNPGPLQSLFYSPNRAPSALNTPGHPSFHPLLLQLTSQDSPVQHPRIPWSRPHLGSSCSARVPSEQGYLRCPVCTHFSFSYPARGTFAQRTRDPTSLCPLKL